MPLEIEQSKLTPQATEATCPGKGEPVTVSGPSGLIPSAFRVYDTPVYINPGYVGQRRGRSKGQKTFFKPPT